MSIRKRQRADGTVVYDASTNYGPRGQTRSFHIGTFDTRPEAEEMLECWRLSGEYDRWVIAERATFETKRNTARKRRSRAAA